MEAAKMKDLGLKALTTKALTEEERNDRTLDFIGGFEIIDNSSRLFVLEGLSDGAMS